MTGRPNPTRVARLLALLGGLIRLLNREELQPRAREIAAELALASAELAERLGLEHTLHPDRYPDRAEPNGGRDSGVEA